MQSLVSIVKMTLSLCSFNVRGLGHKIRGAEYFSSTFILNNLPSVFYTEQIQQTVLKQYGLQIAHTISISVIEAVVVVYLYNDR